MEQQLVLQTLPEGEAPSPFLAGTQIQYAWDSTSLESLKRCARLYQYVMIDGWQPKGEAIHLRFGIEYHQALHDYETYKALSLNHDECVQTTVKDLLVRMKDWDPSPHTKSEEKKSKKNLLRTVVWYLDKFENDPAKTVIFENGRPAIEVSFRFELDWGPRGIEPHEIQDGKIIKWDKELLPSQPYLLSGHLDRIVDFQGALFVMDRKTSVYSLTSYYFDQYHPHNQMSLYSLAGKVVLESPVKGVIIDAAHIAEDYSEFGRGVTYRTPDQIDEWLQDLRYWLGEAEKYATQSYWPMNDTACDKYGGCKFKSICQKSPAARETFLRSEFTQLEEKDRWNPLKPR